MAIVVQFIKEYAQWVYGVCALIALWYLRASLLARRDRRYAVFSLEREAALNRTYGAWTVAIVLLVVIGAIYFLSTVVSDAVAPLVEAENTPTPPAQQVVQVTPQPTLPLPEALLETPTPTPTRAATPRPSPTQAKPTVPTPTPTAAAPAVQAPSCPDPRAIITAPGINQRVSGMVPIMGTAASDKFQYYKLEFGAGINPGVWSYFAGGEKSVRGGQLGTLNSGSLAPGPYTIRVVVVDTTGNYAPPCQTVVIIN